ncbi:Aste57867_18988 [Aphanomyces stellatus]|uniref:Aste57867_18988 protein n=1 Tax=Aphanomyces stellatus TaxID=120398 RepID=A0A485LBS7_9STRA|nr:hypothetical protein As57867_018924 [Aphanomyces stellatus]VFT95714.1 Aste57867_18988 [Aphanomyces stellatus]
MEIRAADAVGDTTATLSLAKGVPYPVPEETEHLQANKAAAEAAAEEERQRRVDELSSTECESAIVREINIEYAIAAMETERIRRMSQHNLAIVHNELLRERSKKEVVELMEAERGRRMSVELLAMVHDEIVREKAKQDVAVEVESERVRRMSQDTIAEVHTHLLRRNSIDKVVELAETERARRVQEQLQQQVVDHVTRRKSQTEAVALMESERARRMSSHDHLHSMVSISSLSVQSGGGGASEEEEHALDGDASPAEAPPLPLSFPDLPVASTDAAAEQKALYELHVALQADLPPCQDAEDEALRDIRLLRFLRGHKGNVQVAADRYTDMLELRQKHHLDAIRDNIRLGNMTAADFPYYEKIKRYYPAVAAYDVADGDHNVFCFEKFGAVDLYGLVVNVTDDEWLAFTLHELEHRALTLDRLSLAHKTLVRCTTLRDLDGFSLTRVTRPVLQRLQHTVSLASACYPESVAKTVFFNTPWVFHTAWRGIQLWLDETQRSKICFLKRGDVATLHAICTPDKLPALLGGSNDAVVLPPTGLLGKDSYALLRENGATEAEIRARDVLTVPFRVNAHDTICWEFCVQGYDVDFSVKFRTQGDGGAVELNVDGWNKARFVHGQVEAASWTAPAAGAAVLCWDNSFSWTRAKTICYKASVAKTVQPGDESIDISGHSQL